MGGSEIKKKKKNNYKDNYNDNQYSYTFIVRHSVKHIKCIIWFALTTIS